MTRRPALRLAIEYDGAGFAGWAEQPGQRTIEGVLHDALAISLGYRAEVRVAGRTDAGVHATGQVASLAVPGGRDVPEPRRLARSLNSLLPDDVAIRSVARAPDGFDARADALSRAYDYRVLTGPPSPLRRHRTLRHVGPALDRPALDRCATATVGRHDFTAFTPTGTQHVFFNRTVLECVWRDVGDELVLRVEADAFLRHMVRVLVGTMLAVGRGVRTVDQYMALLDGAARSEAGPTAPPHALTLVAVRYPDDPGEDGRTRTRVAPRPRLPFGVR